MHYRTFGVRFAIVALLFAASHGFSATYYVAPSGLDANAGTSTSAPWKTFAKAAGATLSPGDTVYFRSGIYNGYVTLSRSGASANPITFAAYPGESPVIDGSNRATNVANPWNGSDTLIRVTGSYVTIRGFEIKNYATFGIYVAGNNAVIDRIHAHNGYMAGVYFYMCSYGLVTNCTVHDVYDYGPGGTGGGGNADGMGSSASNTPSAVYGYHTFRNNIVYNCSDDGIDTWTSQYNTIEGNIVHHCGYSNASNGGSTSFGAPTGNGNGFKLGKGGNNTITGNVAYDNLACGFDSNSGAGNKIHNNTAFRNKSANFINYSYANTLKNNISNTGYVSMDALAVQASNSWNLGITDPRFASVDPTSSGFLRLSAGSPAIDRGTNVGLTYSGTAPDLGAFEFAPTSTPPAPTGTAAINLSAVSIDSGYAYFVAQNFGTPSDSLTAPTLSTLRIYENGRELGPAHALHATIRSTGGGAFSHWDGALYFSTSDNSDPRTNGRTYTYGTSATGGAVVGTGTGLAGAYFDNADFTAAAMTRIDAMVNFDWGMGAPASSMGVDYFSTRWTGQVQAQYTQTYTFYVTGDDGVRLWVNGQLLIDRWIRQAPTEYAAAINLTAGTKYDIQLEYYENYGGAVAQLRWSSSSTPKAIIPMSQLYPAATGGGATGTGLFGQYFDNADFTGAKLARTDSTVNFEWGMGAPTTAMSIDYFSVRWTGQVQAQYTQAYTFHVTGDDGVRLWVNGQLLIDKWLVQSPTEYAATINLTAGAKYDIKLEYYENFGGAVAQLRWSSPSTPKQIIPARQLYPTGALSLPTANG